ncbi:MAG: response regulator transcription factor [Deltaproteobacteria bacterium]|nr:response regulator transcription factor [Deltaproteobacteria bacterium]
MGNTPSIRERVLVVEDEADLSSSLAYALRANGYEAQVADRGDTAMEALASYRPDLVLLDIMLPDMSGLEICRKVRSANSPNQPAIIILSARVQEIDRVVGFEVGADDYVVKPFSVRELMLRIEARLRMRRAAIETAAAKSPVAESKPIGSFVLRNLRVDESAHRVFVDEAEIHVSALEMRVLIYLFKSPGHMRTRRELLTEVWGYHPEVASRTVDTHIKRLRDKLGAAADLLQTVRGVGFRLADPTESHAAGDGAERAASVGMPGPGVKTVAAGKHLRS